MKTIVKGKSPESLVSAQRNNWSWDDYHKNDQNGYLKARNQALAEQNYECAYTGIRLSENSSIKPHLDHFRKKSIYPEKRFEYNNLYAAAKDLNCGSDYKDKQINGKRADIDELYKTFWSPLQSGLATAFWYRQDGFMEPSYKLSNEDRKIAEKTIKMYNLNDPDLKKRRMDIISMISQMKEIDEASIRLIMSESGFSFLVETELQRRGK